MESNAAPPLALVPPFVLPNQHNAPFSTVSLRGRRNLVLVLVPALGADAIAFLRTYAVRREEWAWLHTVVVGIAPTAADFTAAEALPLPVLRDHGAVRGALLPGAEASVAAMLVADTAGRVAEWRTARRIGSLPEADTALAWAWEVARPRGACDGGVSWARPAASELPPPVPIGRFTIGARTVGRPRRSRARRGAQVERSGRE